MQAGEGQLLIPRCSAPVWLRLRAGGLLSRPECSEGGTEQCREASTRRLAAWQLCSLRWIVDGLWCAAGPRGVFHYCNQSELSIAVDGWGGVWGWGGGVWVPG